MADLLRRKKPRIVWLKFFEGGCDLSFTKHGEPIVEFCKIGFRNTTGVEAAPGTDVKVRFHVERADTIRPDAPGRVLRRRKKKPMAVWLSRKEIGCFQARLHRKKTEDSCHTYIDSFDFFDFVAVTGVEPVEEPCRVRIYVEEV